MIWVLLGMLPSSHPGEHAILKITWQKNLVLFLSNLHSFFYFILGRVQIFHQLQMVVFDRWIFTNLFINWNKNFDTFPWTSFRAGLQFLTSFFKVNSCSLLKSGWIELRGAFTFVWGEALGEEDVEICFPVLILVKCRFKISDKYWENSVKSCPPILNCTWNLSLREDRLC